jgi:hypothetical protein
MKMNNRSNNLNGNSMYDLWVIRWLCSKACESESDNPWETSVTLTMREKSTIRDEPSNYELC